MKVWVNAKQQYPSAELLIQPCMEDYKYQLESYNRIYDKVNVTMVLCSAVLLVILSGVELKTVPAMLQATTAGMFFRFAVPFLTSLGSAIMIFTATIQCLNLMRSRKLKLFDSIAFRNEHCYFDPLGQTAFLLVVAYTNATYELRAVVQEKQLSYDATVKNMIIAIILFAANVVIKGIF